MTIQDVGTTADTRSSGEQNIKKTKQKCRGTKLLKAIKVMPKGQARNHALSAPVVQQQKVKITHYQYHGQQQPTGAKHSVSCAIIHDSSPSTRKGISNGIHPE
jgi:hypothetical protein